MNIFRFRPHHIICTLCFCGKGYNDEFIQNFKTIQQKINLTDHNHNTAIQIVDCCDDICAKCPENQDKLCNHESEVIKIDIAYLKLLQLKVGQVIAFDDLKVKAKKLLTMDNFQSACKECSWYPLDICTPIIQKLIG
jgi:uncharacterized protein